MASFFGARRRRSPEDDGEEDRSGSGRAKRSRLSPEEGTLQLAEAEVGADGRSPGWLSSFVSGAKKVMSTVLLFSSSEEQEASGDEEEEEDDGEADGNGDAHDIDGSVVPYSESKLAIEELVMKETFSRDECDKIVKLIQSRVTDSAVPEACEYGMLNETPRRTVGDGHDCTAAWRSLSNNKNLSGPRFSPGSPLHASPDLCSAAVMEAKKWLEDKRQGLGSKPEDHGPCKLNTDVLTSGSGSAMGSPVDLAKSYMESLPPWQSPFLDSQKSKTPPSGGVHVYDEDGKFRYSTPSSKVTTREDYLSNFWANLEESRRARLGSFGTPEDASKFRHYGSTSRLFEKDFSIFSSGTREEVVEPVQNYKGSDKVATAGQPSGSFIPVSPTKNGNNSFVDPVDPAKVNGNIVDAATAVHPDKVAQGNSMSPTSVSKEADDHSGDVKAPSAEPEIHEVSHANSTSELRPKDVSAQIQSSLNGSTNNKTNKTSANGFQDRSNANSGLESSGNDNPSCTNSRSAVPPSSNEFVESTADAADGNSVDNGARMDSEKPEEETTKTPYVRRGRKRVVRSSRGRGK